MAPLRRDVVANQAARERAGGFARVDRRVIRQNRRRRVEVFAETPEGGHPLRGHQPGSEPCEPVPVARAPRARREPGEREPETAQGVSGETLCVFVRLERGRERRRRVPRSLRRVGARVFERERGRAREPPEQKHAVRLLRGHDQPRGAQGAVRALGRLGEEVCLQPEHAVLRAARPQRGHDAVFVSARAVPRGGQEPAFDRRDGRGQERDHRGLPREARRGEGPGAGGDQLLGADPGVRHAAPDRVQAREKTQDQVRRAPQQKNRALCGRRQHARARDVRRAASRRAFTAVPGLQGLLRPQEALLEGRRGHDADLRVRASRRRAPGGDATFLQALQHAERSAALRREHEDHTEQHLRRVPRGPGRVPGRLLRVRQARGGRVGGGVPSHVRGAPADARQVALHVQPARPVQGAAGHPADLRGAVQDQGRHDAPVGARVHARVPRPAHLEGGQGLLQEHGRASREEELRRRADV